MPPAEERALALELAAEEYPRVVVFQERSYLLGFPLRGIGPSRLVAVGVVDALARSRSDMGQEQMRFGKWMRSVHDRLRGANDTRDRRRSQAEQDRQSAIAWEDESC